MWSLKVRLNLNCSLYCAHKALYTECQNRPWPLTIWPKINRVTPLIINNLHVKTQVWKRLDLNCSLYRVHKVLYIECQSWPWPLTPWPKINGVPPLIIHNSHVKFESNLNWSLYPAHKVLYTECQSCPQGLIQSAKTDLDLWPCDQKSIGFFLSSSITPCEVWKWSGKYCSLYGVHKAKCDRHTHGLTHSPNHKRTAALLYPLQHCCKGIITSNMLKIVSIYSHDCVVHKLIDIWYILVQWQHNNFFALLCKIENATTTKCPSWSFIGLWHFQLLLYNHWTYFDKTWQEARTQLLLPSFLFLGWSVNKSGNPGVWLATFSTSILCNC